MSATTTTIRIVCTIESWYNDHAFFVVVTSVDSAPKYQSQISRSGFYKG